MPVRDARRQIIVARSSKSTEVISRYGTCTDPKADQKLDYSPAMRSQKPIERIPFVSKRVWNVDCAIRCLVQGQDVHERLDHASFCDLGVVGAEARRTVEERYSAEIVAPRLAAILSRAAQEL
jgi:hypothetical protein